uniref:2-octaprenylphenol hydroxylase ) n=1 Tax=Ganoderma boninense TaxID=34458 RepID=A0A5K1JZ31_9APHY|nr:2-octaprenylphenol hydroxylase (EC (2-polyprenylphenol 6-hydroxylase) [Ganoderma boninense]
MPGSVYPVAIHVVHAGILTSSEHLDTMVKDLLMPLGFSDDLGQWPTQVGRVLTDLAGAARLSPLQHICATALSFRDRRLDKETGERLANMVYSGMEFKATLELLTGVTSIDSEGLDTGSFDPEARNIIRSNLPELNAISAAFTADLTALKVIEAQIAPLYTILTTPRHDLEAALHAWLRIEVPSQVVLMGRVAILQLTMLADKRRAIVERAGALVSDLTSPHPSSITKHQDRVCEELRGLARGLAIQIRSQRVHLITFSNVVRTVRGNFPPLRRSNQLRLMLGCMMNILNLELELVSFKKSLAA